MKKNYKKLLFFTGMIAVLSWS